MPTPMIFRADPTAKRQSWPWRTLSLGDIVHVYAPRHLHSKVYSAGGYYFPHNPNLQIITKRHTDADGVEYIRCEVVDVRVYRAQQAREQEQEAARLAALRADEDARAEAALAALRGA